MPRPEQLGTALAALPRHLAERAVLVAPAAFPRGGSYVLYWAHHALRVDENPALDLAAELAIRFDWPLLVCTGAFLEPLRRSDRHTSFVLEGVRDFASALAERGVPCAMALDPNESLGMLSRVARNAAVVVTEDFPAAPFPGWSASLVRRTGVPVVLVDTACLVPMNAIDGVFDRAYAFRDATERERETRIAQPWPASPLDSVRWPHVEHGLPEVDWSALRVPEAVARMSIDHAVGPVADTEGGTRAGTARWERFRASELARYAEDRNDAARASGVSRMSAYLGHGMVSPFRVAREAHADLRAGAGAREGAAKYLEELLVWRELAYQWCRHMPQHDTIEALPAWARRTLREHARDERRVLGAQALSRGQTGDALWDLAQRSLLAHGELHNNLRMTWGKAVARWTATPEAAVSTLIELNNRFALDGGDPASYGGLLWCLGLFDRPFAPETAVFGSVRPRPTIAHAERLDLEAYGRVVGRRASDARIAVIGAGMAGIACARILADHNFDVTVFEKSRGMGGRMSTRRGDAGAFDHGAQYFSARDPRFAQAIAQWRSEGKVEEWHARFAEVGCDGAQSIEVPPRYVAVPGMSSLCSHIARGLEVVTEVRIEPLRSSGSRWRIDSTGPGDSRRSHGEFDIVLSTVPAPQAAALIGAAAPALASVATRTSMRAMWSMMWSTRARVGLPFDHAEILAGAPRIGESLGWVSRISSKPGRAADGIDRWVVLARPEWSEDRLERAPEEVLPLIEGEFAALCESLGILLPDRLHGTAHRYRFALAARDGGPGPQFDAQVGIGLGGDWLSGSRIEDAYLSGVALAGRVLGELTQRARASRARAAAQGTRTPGR